MVIFLDTYAIIEIVKGNPNYKNYLEVASITTKFNLVEVYFYFLKNSDENTADENYRKFKVYETDISDDTIKEAMKFKIKHNDKRLSFADCIGYVKALKENAVFLTGDYQFKGMGNVEFIK